MLSGCEKRLPLCFNVYPYSRCQQKRRSHQVHSAESAWFSSAGGAGRTHRISKRNDSELWWEKQQIPVNEKLQYRALPVHSQTSSPAVCCGGCQPSCVPWLDCSETWQSEGLIKREKTENNKVIHTYNNY